MAKKKYNSICLVENSIDRVQFDNGRIEFKFEFEFKFKSKSTDPNPNQLIQIQIN
jgi:hypothetical protein